MCGLVGIAGNLGYKDESTIRRLLMFDYFRGTDSTGLGAVFTDGDIKVAKTASHPINLFDTTRFKAVNNGFKSTAFIGHNRAATKGAVNETNAHPYHHGPVMGAHNGTLTQASWDKLCEIIGEKTGTDSDAIFAAIAKVGIEETVKHLQGAWALTWVDLRDNSLNFLRNKERPFWYCYTADFKKVIWASEFWMLKAANTSAPEKDRDDLHVDDKGFGFFSTQENWHYRFDLAELMKGSSGRPKPRAKELKGKEPAPVTNYGQGNFPRAAHSAGTTGGGNNSTTQSHDRYSAIRNLKGMGTDQFAGYFTNSQLESFGKYGCSWCYADFDPQAEGVVIIEDENLCLCPKCSGSKTTRVYANADRMNKFFLPTSNLPVTQAA